MGVRQNTHPRHARTRHGHNHLEQTYNDGKRYVLHYVTAREVYNIIKAAEAGMTGNPHDYRDYELPPPGVLAAAKAVTAVTT